MRSENGSAAVAYIFCQPTPPAEHAHFDALFSLAWNADTDSAWTNADGRAFHTLTKPNRDR